MSLKRHTVNEICPESSHQKHFFHSKLIRIIHVNSWKFCTITGHVESPDSEAARGKVAGQAVVGIVHVELMRGIGQAMHQQDLALGLRPGHGQTLQVQGDAVAFQREGLDLVFRGGIGTGLWLTFSLRALQFSHLIHAFGLIVRKTPDRKAQGDISNFEALMVALSATVGTGNIAGVATAIYIGGPGALFWMWMTGLVGMATKYAEAVLAVKYRVQNENGTFSGGPMYYISRGLGWKWLATLFAFFAAIATFGIGSMVQSNSVADALNHSFSIAPGITGIVLMGLTAAVIIGGVRSIGRVTALLVPVMIALYVLGALAVILMHITEIPGVLAMVVSSAFQPVAATGGFAGATVMMAIRLGVARGLFSNESGLGSAPIAAAAARTSQPVVQALISMTQTFIDTLVVCSMTGLVILVTGVWTSGKNGAPLTSFAFETGLPGELGGLIVTIGIILFAYSTILGWSYYGEKAIEYLLGSKAIIPYRWAFIISVGLGASMKLDLVWTLSDIFNALMAFPNLIGLIMLTPVVKAETMAYLRSLKKEPVSEG